MNNSIVLHHSINEWGEIWANLVSILTSLLSTIYSLKCYGYLCILSWNSEFLNIWFISLNYDIEPILILGKQTGWFVTSSWFSPFIASYAHYNCIRSNPSVGSTYFWSLFQWHCWGCLVSLSIWNYIMLWFFTIGFCSTSKGYLMSCLDIVGHKWLLDSYILCENLS